MLNKLRHVPNKLRRVLDQLRRVRDELRWVLDELRRLLDELHRVPDQLRQMLDELRQELNELRQVLDKLRRVLNKLRQVLDKLRWGLNGLRQASTSLPQRLVGWLVSAETAAHAAAARSVAARHAGIPAKGIGRALDGAELVRLRIGRAILIADGAHRERPLAAVVARAVVVPTNIWPSEDSRRVHCGNALGSGTCKEAAL